MEPTDITIEILRDIRDLIKGTNERVDGLTEKVDRLEQGQTSLKAEIVTQGLKTAQGFGDVAHELESIRELLADGFALEERIDEHDSKIEAINQRLDRAGIEP